MLTERNIQKYYPKTIETAKRHLNQTRKNVRSTKVKTAPLETCNTSYLHGKKVHDVFTQMYMVWETMFSDQTGQFPTQSLQGNKYIMVMVELDSNTILVKPMKNRKDAKMIRAYNVLLLRLKWAGIVPKKTCPCKPSNGCTLSVDTQSNQHGSKPSKQATTRAANAY